MGFFIQYSLPDPVSNDPDVWLIRTVLSIEVSVFYCAHAYYVYRMQKYFNGGGFVRCWLFSA